MGRKPIKEKTKVVIQNEEEEDEVMAKKIKKPPSRNFATKVTTRANPVKIVPKALINIFV